MRDRIFVKREWFDRIGTVLVPASAYDERLMKKLPVSRSMAVDVTAAPRSGKQHRLYWALLQKVVENHPYYATADALSIWLKVRLGFVVDVVLHDGTVHYRTKSIAFEKMDQVEFNEFFNLAVDVLVTEVLPEVSRDDLLASVEEMLGISISEALQITEPTRGKHQ
jgi:hypothetical protein